MKKQTVNIIKQFTDNYNTRNFKSNSLNQKKIIKSILNTEIPITVVHGRPGTGKTFSAIQGALKEFKSNGTYEKIYLMKSVKTLDNKSEDIGFLKGTIEDKIAPFIFSYDFNFCQIINKENYSFARENNIIEFLPLAFIRGIGLKNAIIILDEAQNVNTSILRTVLSRVGKNCKLIILGDTQQKDSNKKQSSGLDFMVKYFKDKIKGISFIEMDKSDQSRSDLINEIEDLYDSLEDQGIDIY